MRIGIALPRHLAAIADAEARRHGHEVGFVVGSRVELAIALGEGERPAALLVAATSDLLDIALLDEADRLGIRVVAIAGERRDPAAERLGMPIVPAGSDWATIDAALVADGSSADGDGDARAAGAVVAVWGGHGAPGRTTLACAVAAELAADGTPVALVDADAHAASIALTLGLLDEAAGLAGACRLAAAGALDDGELLRLSTPLPVGPASLRVLTGITRPDRWPELAADRIVGVLDACRRWRAVTVVDVAASVERDEELMSDTVGPRRNAAALAVLATADAVVLVGSGDPVGVARLIAASATLGEVTAAEVVPVVNRVRAAVIGADGRHQLVTTLARFGGIHDPILVPLDQAAADRALRIGAPLPIAAPRARSTAAVRRLVGAVRSVVGADGEAPTPR